jgi:hypothetical protein
MYSLREGYFTASINNLDSLKREKSCSSSFI